MLTYLDSCIFIYWIEGPAPFDTVYGRISLASRQRAIASRSANSLGWNAWSSRWGWRRGR